MENMKEDSHPDLTGLFTPRPLPQSPPPPKERTGWDKLYHDVLLKLDACHWIAQKLKDEEEILAEMEPSPYVWSISKGIKRKKLQLFRELYCLNRQRQVYEKICSWKKEHEQLQQEQSKRMPRIRSMSVHELHGDTFSPGLRDFLHPCTLQSPFHTGLLGSSP
ncbi:uncharacterized protein LOC109280979 isoform X1 [Alligator mississippiensis]|uniref:uncharacterized protein LOC109280979 isoform X1 n=1 Tax=Alligator mississippiensis TaxID=8496 RepID=UPI002877FD35|nr:uncharacterized protein LOC109280979 isoform X1 [Alligator mississippiensis]